MVITPGVLAATSSTNANLDYMGRANSEQTMNYYSQIAGRPETELEAMYQCRNILLNGEPCHPASMGEIAILGTNRVIINELLAKGGKVEYLSSLALASSTISNNASTIYRRTSLNGTPSTNSKTTQYNYLPVSMLNVKFNNPGIYPNTTIVADAGGTGAAWIQDEEGWWNLPKNMTYGQTATIRFDLKSYLNSRVRLTFDVEDISGSEYLYLGKINTTTVSSLNYYMRVGAAFKGIGFYDYIIPQQGENFIIVNTQKISNSSTTSFKVKLESIL